MKDNTVIEILQKIFLNIIQFLLFFKEIRTLIDKNILIFSPYDKKHCLPFLQNRNLSVGMENTVIKIVTGRIFSNCS